MLPHNRFRQHSAKAKKELPIWFQWTVGFITVLGTAATVYFAIKTIDLTKKYGENKEQLLELKNMANKQESTNNSLAKLYKTADSSFKLLRTEFDLSVRNEQPNIGLGTVAFQQNLGPGMDTLAETINLFNYGGRPAYKFSARDYKLVIENGKARIIRLLSYDSAVTTRFTIPAKGPFVYKFFTFSKSHDSIWLFQNCFDALMVRFTDETTGKKNHFTIYFGNDEFSGNGMSIGTKEENMLKAAMKGIKYQ